MNRSHWVLPEMMAVLSHCLSSIRPPSKHQSSPPSLIQPFLPSLRVRFSVSAPGVRRLASVKVRRRLKVAAASMEIAGSQMAYDIVMASVGSGVALGLLIFWEEMAKRGVFQQVDGFATGSAFILVKKIGGAFNQEFVQVTERYDLVTNRKLVHISIGLVFVLFWPWFSSGAQAPYLAAAAPGINIIRMLLLGLGVWKNEATVKSISRHGDYRELLKGPLYYACTITLATILFWRTSPIGFATICNLCAGDGVADIIGRKFGNVKLPYNQKKSFAGTIAMVVASFIASVMYMHYFSIFGLIPKSWSLVTGFFLMSLVAALVESLPISTEVDDNLTVPLVSALVGCLVF